MVRYIFEQSDEVITTFSGLSAVGQLLDKTSLSKRLNKVIVPDVTFTKISNSDIAISYIGLLCQGKNDFEYIECYRDDFFFTQSLGIKNVPSSSRLRQRLDIAAGKWENIILEESAKMIKAVGATITPCYENLVALDIDVSPFDNSKTKKEGVSRTYKGFDGYAPIFAYLGQEGYCVNVELRAGKTHCQNGTVEFLKQSILYTKSITDAPILVRMDAGNDTVENIRVCREEETRADFIIKRNLRRESPELWLYTAQQHGKAIQEREGKTVYWGEVKTLYKNLDEPVRIVFKVTEESIREDGQMMIEPDIKVETWLTSLSYPPEVIAKLYCDHGTSEQFHSEMKTDMDLERLPSGKFATNNLILHLGILAYNILRVMGQESLRKNDAPVRKKVSRRRIRTVIQNLITLAAKLVQHGRRYYLRFGRSCAWFYTAKRLYTSFT